LRVQYHFMDNLPVKRSRAERVQLIGAARQIALIPYGTINHIFGVHAEDLKMRTHKLFNLFIACLFLLATFALPGQNAVRASDEGPVEPEAITAPMPPPIDVFPGMQRPDNPGTDPDIYPTTVNINDPRVIGAVPDTTGAAGHTHFLQAVNKMVAIYQKDGTLVDSATFTEFWATSTTTTACSDQAGALHHGQPYVLYDHLAGRWVVVDVAYENIDNGPYFLCVAVSNGLLPPAPPTPYFDSNFWYYYTLSTDQGSVHFYPDSPKLGLWPDGYYLAADMYDVFNNGFNRTPRGLKVWALKRADLISGNILPGIWYKDFYLTEHMGYEHLVPSNLLGTNAPPMGTPNYFASIQPGKMHIWEFHVDWNDLDLSTFGDNLVPNFTFTTDTSLIWAIGNLVPQLGTAERLDAHGERLMSPLQYRILDGVPSLWTNHTVLSDGVTGVRWYEIRAPLNDAPYIYQEGTHQPNNDFRWLGSLAVDRVGNMALGYSASSPSINPKIRYAGRLRSDLLNKLPQTERLFRVGGFPPYDGSQYDGDGIPDGPWGRQSQMSVDPLDECVFWYTNMYYDANSAGTEWRTAIGWFSFPQCRGGLIKRISLHTDDTQGNASSGLDFEMYSVGISEDGRYVAFSSEASTLVDGDTNGHRDVFLRDRDKDGDGLYDEPGFVETTRISLAFNGAQANDDSWEVAISPDASFIVFSSDANNLIQDDNNGVRDVFRYDRQNNAIRLVSARNGTFAQEGNGPSDHPFIAGSTNLVVFRSEATDLVNGDTNISADIFRRNMVTNQTYRFIPHPSTGNPQSNGDSFTPTISNNGVCVAYASFADNLVTSDLNGTLSDVFVDCGSGPILVSASASGDLGDSYTPFISGNSRYVAFASRAYSLDLVEAIGDYDADIFVYDRVIGTNSRVSVNFFGAEALNGDSYSPSISRDGRIITFASDANNLDVHLPDLNARRDIFVHDRTLALSGVYDFGLTQRISLSYNQGEPNDWSFAPVISQDGDHVAFVSEATNLVTNDTNSVWDVFAYNSQRNIPIFLSIPGNIPGSIGSTVSVPVIFDGNGMAIDTTTFSMDYDQSCLRFNPGLPNAIVFNLPASFITSWTFTPGDANGELDISIYDPAAPLTPIPNATIVTVKLEVKSACASSPSPYLARVGFSTDPAASFGSNGLSILGYTLDGFVHILAGLLGDCNGDGLVDAGDLSGLVLEIFDGDGSLPNDTPGGTFDGNPVGCNPNQDIVVDAGDLSCTVLIIYGGGSAACMGGPDPLKVNLLGGGSSGEGKLISLIIPASVPIWPGGRAALPIAFDPQGQEVASLVFSVDFDQSWISFNPSDVNGDGLPDAIDFNLPDGFLATAQYDPADTDGELDVVVYHLGMPQASLPAGNILTIGLVAGRPQGTFLAEVKSSLDPHASFGSPAGMSLDGVAVDGSMLIAGEADNLVFLPVTIYKR